MNCLDFLKIITYVIGSIILNCQYMHSVNAKIKVCITTSWLSITGG